MGRLKPLREVTEIVVGDTWEMPAIHGINIIVILKSLGKVISRDTC